MFVRFVTIAGEKAKTDAALDFMENSVRPRIEASAGNKGLATLIAADQGLTVGASYWSDDVAMEAAEEALASVRQQVAVVAGGTLRIEEYEIAGYFRQATPTSGAVAELARFELDVTKLDQVVAIFNEDSVRCLKAAAGFCCAQLFIDREFGHGMVGTSWEDESSARAFRIPARELRAQLAQRASVTILGSELYRLGAM
jgi:hypothetical protein